MTEIRCSNDCCKFNAVGECQKTKINLLIEDRNKIFYNLCCAEREDIIQLGRW